MERRAGRESCASYAISTADITAAQTRAKDAAARALFVVVGAVVVGAALLDEGAPADVEGASPTLTGADSSACLGFESDEQAPSIPITNTAATARLSIR